MTGSPTPPPGRHVAPSAVGRPGAGTGKPGSGEPVAGGQIVFALIYNGLLLGAGVGLLAAGVSGVAVVGLLFFGFGAAAGSFLNQALHRLPRGIPLDDPPSSCPRCGTVIRRRDNIPLLGWVLLGGKCRACAEPIPARYPLVELACGVLMLGAFAAECAGGWWWHGKPDPPPDWWVGPLHSRRPDVWIKGGVAGVAVLSAWLLSRDGFAIRARAGWAVLVVLAGLTAVQTWGLPAPAGPLSLFAGLQTADVREWAVRLAGAGDAVLAAGVTAALARACGIAGWSAAWCGAAAGWVLGPMAVLGAAIDRGFRQRPDAGTTDSALPPWWAVTAVLASCAVPPAV